MTPTRRNVLGAALGGAAAATAGLPAPAAHAASWQLRWSPSASGDGLRAFETLEDDRAGSHPSAAPHIRAVGDTWRFDMHTVDRDTATDRQRHEVTGLRTGESYLRWTEGQTWRVTYGMYIPASLRATTSFTHLMQMKQPGAGTSPLVVQSLRRVEGAQTIELKLPIDGILVGRTALTPLHDSWVDVDFRVKVGNGSAGSVRWILRKGPATLIDVSRSGVDTFLADRLRPKWGIYRSLGDTSDSLRNCHLLLRNMKGYQLV
ncbi:Tat pathway signal sequence domain protein [Streptomyces scabiei]|uniref:Tat pathway signal sequence domain protein n=1 Tax=Streptomyces scabiei TaxID=1930 RepID=UPI0029ACFAA0|nr:Tat pathway signal sequence domain protein [Streptomyces scabiei]MDX3517117.1 Tat pathway signal sequence domain protein [Streptomyces scabiei]